MSITRRKTLALLGGGIIVAAGVGTGLHVSRTPEIALQPWSDAGRYDDPRMNALSHAILAPNPHNRQPWLVDLAEPGKAILFADTDRLLPETDPFSRQIVIGLGCFLEILRMAAAQDGYAVDVRLFPEGAEATHLDRRPVAVCSFRQGDGTPDPLFAHVLDRRSLKEPFDTTRTVAQGSLDAILAAARTTRVGGSVAEASIAELRALSHAALKIEIETPHTFRESVDLFRIGAREVDANPDGIDFSGPMFEAMSMMGLFTREAAADSASVAYAEGLKAVFANTDTAMGHLWQVTRGNGREDQIAAGRDWVRLNLAATGQGVGMQPLSQALQEYPEMAGPYRDIHRRLAPDGGTVQMFARIGYGPDVPQSPRWGVNSKIVNA